MTAKQPTVFLFDIDGTLVTTGGAGRRALEVALEETLGLGEFRASFPFAGMTDRAIIRRMLQEHGHSYADADVGGVLAGYLDALRAELAEATAFHAHKGVESTLTYLRDNTDWAVGLGTGNIERGARIKLEPVGLNSFFSFGGYGSDHELRPELIRIGAERGAASLGLPFDAVRVVVIGDTPKDVSAAKAIGAESVAVCTGGGTRETLTASGATHVFDDLTDPSAMMALLGEL